MEKKAGDSAFYLFGLRIVGDFGVTIALPVVLFAWLGKTLDARWGTKPTFLLVGFLLAALISAVSVYRKTKRYGKEYQSMMKPR